MDVITGKKGQIYLLGADIVVGRNYIFIFKKVITPSWGLKKVKLILASVMSESLFSKHEQPATSHQFCSRVISHIHVSLIVGALFDRSHANACFVLTGCSITTQPVENKHVGVFFTAGQPRCGCVQLYLPAITYISAQIQPEPKCGCVLNTNACNVPTS